MRNEIIKYSNLEKVAPSKDNASLIQPFNGRLFKRTVRGFEQFLEVQYCLSNDSARAEVMASKLYHLAGVSVPKAHLVDLGGNFYAVGKVMNGYLLNGKNAQFVPGNVQDSEGKTDASYLRARYHYDNKDEQAFLARAKFFGHSHNIKSLQDEALYVFRSSDDVSRCFAPRRLGAMQLDNSNLEDWKNNVIGDMSRAQEAGRIAEALDENGAPREAAEIIFEYGPKDMKARFDIFTKLMDRVEYFHGIKKDDNTLFYQKLYFLNAVLNAYNNNFSLTVDEDRNDKSKEVVKIVFGKERLGYDESAANQFIDLLAGYGIRSTTKKDENGVARKKAIHNGIGNAFGFGDPKELRYAVLTKEEFDILFSKVMENQKAWEHSKRHDASYFWFFISKITSFIVNAPYQLAEACMSLSSSAYNSFACSFNIKKGATNDVGREAKNEERGEGWSYNTN